MNDVNRGLVIYTAGHSTRPIEELIALLHAHGVVQLIDVRTIPRSRRHPQFDRDALSASLGSAGIAYAHMPGLGGLRKARADSINTGWRNAGFRGYADYMQTPEFATSLQSLLVVARAAPTAIMCAEAVPWRCHRSLIADALAVRGVDVRHVTGGTAAEPHALTAFARIDGLRITYPGDTEQGRLALD